MSNNKHRVSIGLPVYNGGRFLEETLNSLLSQTYPDFDLIISDNASTDDTEAICRAYAHRDPRIRYHRNEENAGLAWNCKRVFELSTGEYFKWAAADDVCVADYLARCMEVLDAHATVVLAYTKTKFIDEFGQIVNITDPGWNLRSEAAHERLRCVIYSGHWVNSLFGLIRSEALSETRLIGSYPGADYRLLGELSLKGKFFEIPEYLFLRRLHPGASSHNRANLEWQIELIKGTRGNISLPFWHLSIDHFTTIILSELSISQKLSLIGSLLRRMHWHQRSLLDELKFALKMSFRRSSP